MFLNKVSELNMQLVLHTLVSTVHYKSETDFDYIKSEMEIKLHAYSAAHQ